MIGALQGAKDYQAFEATIIADFDTQSAVERELVLRLASLLWRLRRATTIETGLFEIQAEHLRESKRAREALPPSREIVYALFGRAHSASDDRDSASDAATNATTVPSSGSKSVGPAFVSTLDLARCFFASR